VSWDIFVQNLPLGVNRVADIPGDFRSAPLGRRSEIIAKIQEAIPIADFSDPSWGIIDGKDWSIEVSMGDEEICSGFALHARGSDAASGAVAAILSHLGLRALDSQTGEFFVAGPAAVESFRHWRKYRSQITGPGS
jgi:hypothetical protein